MADDPWEAAFGAYRQSLVDYNGDGIPDAVIQMPQGMVTSTPPPTATGQVRRQIQRRGMAGLEPTEQQNALLRASMPQLEANSESLGNFGMELTGIPQVGRAGTAIGKAYTDPSLGNVANAGLQSALAAVPFPLFKGFKAFMPMKYAAPIIGTHIGVELGSSQASAQTNGIEQRLRQMSPQDLMAYQQAMGVAADGKIGPNTISAAARFEEQQRAAQQGEASRIEAQGKADAAKQSSLIEAQTMADIQRQKAASELRATDAQRPFLQRFPEYSNIAPWAAGAAAAAIPMAGALLTRRGATAPMRQQARSIDASVGAFNAAPTPLAARTVAEASAAVPVSGAAAPSGINRLMDAGSIGVGAAMPSAAVVAPSFIDYMQPSGSQAKEQAAQEFTLDKLRERMTGPFALGLAMAGGGRFIGEKAGAAFMNPAPRGANAAQAQAITGMVKQAGGDDTALANNLINSFRGGQTSILESKRMQGAAAAEPPYIRMNDIEISSAPARSGQRTRSSALSDPQRMDIQADLLTGRSVQDIAQQYGASATSIASIHRKTQDLVKAAGGDAGEALRRLQTYRSVRDHSFAIPAAIGGGVAAEGPVNRLLQFYQGGDY